VCVDLNIMINENKKSKKAFFSDFSAEELISEKELMSNKPSKSDIIHVKRILKDFGIMCEIPEFDNILKLQRWMRDKIKKSLQGDD